MWVGAGYPQQFMITSSKIFERKNQNMRSVKYKIDRAMKNQDTTSMFKPIFAAVKKEIRNIIWDNVGCPQHLAPVYFRLHSNSYLTKLIDETWDL